jgi:hypothetical protein
MVVATFATVQRWGLLRRAHGLEYRGGGLDAHLPAGMSDEGNRRAQDRRRQKIMRKR